MREGTPLRGVVVAILGVILISLAACGGRDSSANRPVDAPAGQSVATGQSAAPSGSVQPTAAPKLGGTLTFGVRKELRLMNPLVATESFDYWLRQLIFEPLVEVDMKGELQPALAEAWEVSEGGRLYTFKLRRARFHNGEELSAEDAKFAMEYTMDPRNGAIGLPRLNLVDRIEAAERSTLKVYLKEASASFLAGLASIKAFSVVPKGSLPEGTARMPEFPPGTGPFKFVQWQPNQQMVLERYDDYWGQKSYLDRVVMRPIPDETIRFTALRTGEVDAIEFTPYAWVRDIGEGKIRGIGYAGAPTAGFRGFVLNVAAPPFDNKKLRQAVAHALDRDELLRASFFGFGKPTNQRYPVGHKWHLDVRGPARDLSRARALVQESGYDGQPITMMIEQGGPVETEAQILQKQLKEIGLDLRIEVLESGAYSARKRDGSFAITSGGGTTDPDPSNVYGTELLCPPDLKRRAANESGYCDAEMDGLLNQAERELSPERRKALFERVVARQLEDVPELYIGFVPRFHTFRDHVKGFDTGGDGSFRWYGGGLNYTWLDR
jgi:ABC-type transport system substrate-binding protein